MNQNRTVGNQGPWGRSVPLLLNLADTLTIFYSEGTDFAPRPSGFLDRPTALQKIMNESAQASWTLHCSSKEDIGHMQYLTSCYFGGIHKCRRPFFIRFQWPGYYLIFFIFLEVDFFIMGSKVIPRL